MVGRVTGFQSILWRRLDRAGHEYARLFLKDSRWHLTGVAVVEHDRKPCRLDYVIVCDSRWQTVNGKVSGSVGAEAIDINISVDSTRRWEINGSECLEVAGCTDLDLNFSPSTNLLPIRRLGLSVGEEATVRAAWLRFPSFALEPLEQVYRRIDESTYRYESAGGQFVADLQTNEAGFVIQYPNFCEALAQERSG
ncbi:MAG TPA: putative glycolipid-binding domain-containing protein [Blastocatellia bacterium]|nr:putative glycolipid-binding domain-containing protein [Blastocatellia bacterium]